MEEDGIENNFPRKYQTRETADLFMALIMHPAVRHGQRPLWSCPTVFFGEGVKTTLTDCWSSTCTPSCASPSVQPLHRHRHQYPFFEKGGPTKEVWFFGTPIRGYKSIPLKPLTIAEFDREKAQWAEQGAEAVKPLHRHGRSRPRSWPNGTTTDCRTRTVRSATAIPRRSWPSTADVRQLERRRRP